jgi:hypothetical protein
MPTDESSKKIELIDVNSMTIDDIKKIKNPALIQALLEVVRLKDVLAKPEHTSHGMHTNYLKEATQFVNFEINSRVLPTGVFEQPKIDKTSG